MPITTPTAPSPLRKRGSNPWFRRAMVFVTCVLLADAVFGNRGAAEWFKARRDYRRATESLAELKHANAALRDEARRLREDSSTIERVARENLGLIRPGEILVRVSDRK